MKSNWDPEFYDAPRRRLVPCYDAFYGTVAELIGRTAPARPRILDLGAGTGLLGAAVARRVPLGELVLLDQAPAMLAVAQQRLAAWSPRLVVADLTQSLPAGPFDVVMSALAIHHLADDAKRTLYADVRAVLAPGGLFVNAEQVRGADDWGAHLAECVHLDSARSAGSAEVEIAAAVERMRIDRCASAEVQVDWLREAGYHHADIFYKWFRFAVFAGWNGASVPIR